jgi:CheY-like chemotaxis protein
MSDSTRIISVEDDPLQAAWIKQTIEQKINGTLVIQIATESEFVKKLPEILADPPSLILLDVMLRWADPSPDIPERPLEVKEGGMRRAGLRCRERLSGNPATKNVPVVLYTVLDNQELAELEKELAGLLVRVEHVQKNSDPKELVETIQRQIKQV